MKRFTDAVESALVAENWYAALTMSLALPDICGYLADKPRGRKRYIEWCTKYITLRYTRKVGPQKKAHIFLHGEDCYALRCSVLHSGTDDITDQEARKALESFVFVAPPPEGMVHCNQNGKTLQLQVDIFCRDFVESVAAWKSDNQADWPRIEKRMADLVEVRDPSSIFSGSPTGF